LVQENKDIQKLQSDEQAIEAKSQVTVGQLTAFRAEVQAISPPSGPATTAPESAFQTLSSDASALLSSGTFTSAQQAQIVNDFAAVLTSAGATPAQATQAATDLQAIITASGITASDISQIQGDVKAVNNDFGTSDAMAGSGSTSTPPANPDPFDLAGPLLAEIVMGQAPAGPVGAGLGSGPAWPMAPVTSPIPTAVASSVSVPTSMVTSVMPLSVTPRMTGMPRSTDPVMPVGVTPPPNSPPPTGGSTGS
jgi:hypothetical protein